MRQEKPLKQYAKICSLNSERNWTSSSLQTQSAIQNKLRIHLDLLYKKAAHKLFERNKGAKVMKFNTIRGVSRSSSSPDVCTWDEVRVTNFNFTL
jgi:hypothetical protein